MQQIVQEAPKKKKKLGIGSRIFVFFLCIFLFIFGVASMVLYSVRNALSKKNLNEVITETEDFTEIEIGKLMGESVDDDETLAHYILDQIPDEQKEMFPELTEENLSKLLENKEVKELASSALGDLVAYYTGESDKLEIDADKIVDTLTENSDLIEEYTGKKMEKSDFDEVRRQITDFNENELKEIADQETGDLTKVLKIVRFVFSDTCMYILFGITGFFALMILLTCGRFIDSSLIHIGATAAIAGGLAFGGVKFGKEKFAEALDGKLGKSTVEMLEKVLFTDIDTVGLIVLCCGAALILFGIIIKIVRAAMAK